VWEVPHFIPGLTEQAGQEGGRLRMWEHEHGRSADLRTLGSPNLTDVVIQDEFGIDFIPVVQTKFQDVGELRGNGAYTHVITRITEADRHMTRLHQLAHRHNVTWALRSGGLDGAGRPLPAPDVREPGEDGAAAPLAETGIVTMGDEPFLTLPGGSELDSLVPNLQFEALLDVLKHDIRVLEDDLPEMAYTRIRDMTTDLSGRAIRMMLGDAVDKAIEARGNFEQGLVRLDMMGITIAQRMRIPGFEGLGRFDDQSLEHSFAPRDIIPIDQLEQGQADQATANARLTMKQIGFSTAEMLRLYGYSQDEITKILDEAAAEAETKMEQFAGQFNGNTAPAAAAAERGNGQQNGQP
jgi:hypothetical protein